MSRSASQRLAACAMADLATGERRALADVGRGIAAIDEPVDGIDCRRQRADQRAEPKTLSTANALSADSRFLETPSRACSRYRTSSPVITGWS